ncbi:hypothetical protein EZV62_019034 [Acer yangbiense]|uniref:glucan endo-1,3-beta-D-glucosidase n=1 Tax=Acer yangbiense TaxID=1000413 RepID=A0A5C7H9Z0_9ROSI|nr:hypothetical protein EZV62_019034 [Acer yangbiense]
MNSMRLHSPVLLVVLFIFWFLSPGVASLGVNYGQIADNLPPPENVVPLVQSISATKVKIFDVNPQVIRAFANTGIELTVGLGNELLSDMQNPDNALMWVTVNIQASSPATKISGIAVGNEVLTLNDTSFRNSLVPAMHNIFGALVKLGLDRQIFVTTPHAINILALSYPPSSGCFRQDLIEIIIGIVSFHNQTGSPFFINAYPYFVYKDNPTEIDLDLVLFRPNVKGFFDQSTNLYYDNMLYAQVDAVYSALASLGAMELLVHVSETGWPSAGDENEAGATLENAKEYNGNLMKLVDERKGTPMRPNSELNVYIFALFNEDLKAGKNSERNFGLFKPDGTPAYSLPLRPIAEDNGIASMSFDGFPRSPSLARQMKKWEISHIVNLVVFFLIL